MWLDRVRHTLTQAARKDTTSEKRIAMLPSGKIPNVVCNEGVGGYTTPELPHADVSPMNTPLQLHVTKLGGLSFDLDVNAVDTLESVKEMIHQQHGIPAGIQRLVMDSVLLEDSSSTLADLKVEDHANLQLLLSVGVQPGLYVFSTTYQDKRVAEGKGDVDKHGEFCPDDNTGHIYTYEKPYRFETAKYSLTVDNEQGFKLTNSMWGKAHSLNNTFAGRIKQVDNVYEFQFHEAQLGLGHRAGTVSKWVKIWSNEDGVPLITDTFGRGEASTPDRWELCDRMVKQMPFTKVSDNYSDQGHN